MKPMQLLNPAAHLPLQFVAFSVILVHELAHAAVAALLRVPLGHIQLGTPGYGWRWRKIRIGPIGLHVHGYIRTRFRLWRIQDSLCLAAVALAGPAANLGVAAALFFWISTMNDSHVLLQVVAAFVAGEHAWTGLVNLWPAGQKDGRMIVVGLTCAWQLSKQRLRAKVVSS